MKDLQFRSSKSQVMNINMKTFVRVIHFPFMKEEKRTRNSKLNKKKKQRKIFGQLDLVRSYTLPRLALGSCWRQPRKPPVLSISPGACSNSKLSLASWSRICQTHSTYHDYEKEIFKEINIFGWVLEEKESVTHSHRVANTWQQWTKIGSTWQLRAM